MQNRVEPPILLSRLMTFVFATALVVLVVMVVTLYKMFPLNRPQVFFLMTQPNHDQTITLHEMPPLDENLDMYKRAFVKEYIRARNEISPNINVMRKKWMNDPGAAVRAWSGDAVYKDFFQTRMRTALMNEVPDFDIKCPVEFHSRPMSRGTDIYEVYFRWFCENSGGQVAAKDYTIILRLESDEKSQTKWTSRLANPLGLRVVEYKVTSVDGNTNDNTDPLNSF